jgi:hypothetical protein
MLALGIVVLGAALAPAWHQYRYRAESFQAFDRPLAGQTHRGAASSYWFGRP